MARCADVSAGRGTVAQAQNASAGLAGAMVRSTGSLNQRVAGLWSAPDSFFDDWMGCKGKLYRWLGLVFPEGQLRREL